MTQQESESVKVNLGPPLSFEEAFKRLPNRSHPMARSDEQISNLAVMKEHIQQVVDSTQRMGPELTLRARIVYHGYEEETLNFMEELSFKRRGDPAIADWDDEISVKRIRDFSMIEVEDFPKILYVYDLEPEFPKTSGADAEEYRFVNIIVADNRGVEHWVEPEPDVEPFEFLLAFLTPEEYSILIGRE